ncbi:MULTISPECIES: 16S rRNA (guanine(966)-N(2))-methyltransferase RsmD [Prauserella salsuginis group]|uniref:16S rRNA (Guanine966-N2)-methyltransferase n=2 Tax=Prauserella salsuginis group TaxID=2893672 RepID=A0A839XFB4_9PSEU|nr:MULTISPECIES: 16S rRNA (guanine(966)-N(2))-methyltransferase RsmD [Prauserella salsuginis group]MBB3661451.1 16S rRNA (guanine966-N2)-methyltransferase [Prauserella sediminis]MCR3719372.1 16S rRNA (guanine966-N2)-methyltransferase [Prauserella flava]MCR3735614.1 16S rRNA (guanine966-N2)-methyltransferase [Prauserella salsuginis]
MTRIVAGQAGGRTLRVPPRTTRPTSERVREALFNSLENAGDLDGTRVLDLYAGSGALGLEALSRGAADVLFVESDRRAAEVLRANVAAVGLGGHVRQAPVEAVVAEGSREPFDVVLVDPPYALTGDALAGVLSGLVRGGWLTDRGLVVVERPAAGGDPDWPAGLAPLRTKRYGGTALYRAEVDTDADVATAGTAVAGD